MIRLHRSERTTSFSSSATLYRTAKMTTHAVVVCGLYSPMLEQSAVSSVREQPIAEHVQAELKDIFSTSVSHYPAPLRRYYLFRIFAHDRHVEH